MVHWVMGACMPAYSRAHACRSTVGQVVHRAVCCWRAPRGGLPVVRHAPRQFWLRPIQLASLTFRRAPWPMCRCCLRWAAFSADPQACSVLEHFTALLAHATDEDVIAARYHQHHASAGGHEQQQQQAQGEGEGDLLGEGDGGRSDVSGAAPGGATGEMAYW